MSDPLGVNGPSAQPQPDSAPDAVVVGGTKGGVGTTTVTVLTAFGLAAAHRDGRAEVMGAPVLVDPRGDVTIALARQPGPGVYELAQGAAVEEVVCELLNDPAADLHAAAGMPLLLRMGSAQAGPLLADVDAAVDRLIEDGLLPVVDCGSRAGAVSMMDSVADRWRSARLMVTTPTVAAGEGAALFDLEVPGVVVRLGEGLLSVEQFASAFGGVAAVIDWLEAWDGWQHDHVAHVRLAESRDGSGDPNVAAAIDAVTRVVLPLRP